MTDYLKASTMEQPYYIGIMSGTSADGIDAAIAAISNESTALVETHTLSIPEPIKSIIFNLASSGQDEIEKIQYLDFELAKLYSQVSLELCSKANIDKKNIKAIGCHGQTIRHCPPSLATSTNNTIVNSTNPRTNGYTLQVGDPNIIAEQTGITTVADFRRRDIAAGGHGAPLASAFHKAVFSHPSDTRVILNTGGIANITYLPGKHSKKHKLTGFDTGPANGLMDAWCQLHLGKHYDESGKWAASGNVNEYLLNDLLDHSYFDLPPPKSTGREAFNIAWVKDIIQNQRHKLSTVDTQATLTELTARTITDAIKKIDDQSEVYICGGGANNGYLCDRIKSYLPQNTFNTTHTLGIHPDWVEATAFAWLAQRAINKLSGNLPNVTGAKKEVICGGIYWA